MQRGLMLTVSQVVIAIMILQSVALINSSMDKYIVEIEAVEKIKDLEMFSYNIMFDLCYNLKKWGPDLEAGAGCGTLDKRLAAWMDGVKDLLRDEGSLELEVKDLQVEEYNGQPCDAVQMAFIGGDERCGKYISGTLLVDFDWLFIEMHREFNIRIAV
jgi:hypothetical protein